MEHPKRLSFVDLSEKEYLSTIMLVVSKEKEGSQNIRLSVDEEFNKDSPTVVSR